MEVVAVGHGSGGQSHHGLCTISTSMGEMKRIQKLSNPLNYLFVFEINYYCTFGPYN
jgi:hypothetical protein